MKKLFIILVVLIVTASCSTTEKTLSIPLEQVNKIEVYKGFSGEQITMKNNFEKDLLIDLNKANKISPRKFMKPYSIMIYYNSGNIDTIRTNGTLHIINGYYLSKENLIDKYKE